MRSEEQSGWASAPTLETRRFAGPLFLFLLSFALYANTLRNGFVFDDVHQILENPWIRDFSQLGQIFQTHFWAFAGLESDYYRPLAHVAFAVLNAPFGPAAWVFHLASVVLHGVVTVLVYLVASRLIPDRRDTSAWIPLSAAMVSGLVFATHPIHTEAVAWISSLPDLTCAALFLAGLLLFLDPPQGTGRWTSRHAVAGLCYLASALFKESGLTLPVVVALLDLARHPRNRPASYWGSRYGALVFALATYLILRHSAIGGFAPAASEDASDPVAVLTGAGAALWRYLAMLTAPVRLNVFQTIDSATGLPPMAAIVGIPLAAALAVWRRSVSWASAIVLFAVPLIPALYAPALLPGLDNPWAERYVYLPSVGFVIGVGSLYATLCHYRPSLRRAAALILAIIVLASSGATVWRNRVWKDDLTLWFDAVRKSPNAGEAHSYLGYALFVDGEVGPAIEQYRLAIRLKPEFADAHHNLGVALAVTGRHDDAVRAYLAAIERKPGRALTRANLSISLSAMRRPDEALDQADRALVIDSSCAKAYQARGVALGQFGRISEAAECFRRAVELDPDDAVSRANLENANRMLKPATQGR